MLKKTTSNSTQITIIKISIFFITESEGKKSVTYNRPHTSTENMNLWIGQVDWITKFMTLSIIIKLIFVHRQLIASI